jgi:hypothetical protein
MVAEDKALTTILIPRNCARRAKARIRAAARTVRGAWFRGIPRWELALRACHGALRWGDPSDSDVV